MSDGALHRGFTAPLLLAAALAFPSAALAGPSTVTSELPAPGSFNNDLTVAAPVGDIQPHSITVAPQGFQLVVTDDAGVVAGAGCTSTGPTTATCNDADAVDVMGGNGDDLITLRTNKFSALNSVMGFGGNDVLKGSNAANDELTGGTGRDRLFGGGGSDRLRGGAGPDLLDGGRSADGMKGGPGIDRINARDDLEDLYIVCQGGNDRKEAARVDAIDPPASSC